MKVTIWKGERGCDYSAEGMVCCETAAIALEFGLRIHRLCPRHASQVVGEMVEKLALLIPEKEDRRRGIMGNDPTW